MSQRGEFPGGSLNFHINNGGVQICVTETTHGVRVEMVAHHFGHETGMCGVTVRPSDLRGIGDFFHELAGRQFCRPSSDHGVAESPFDKIAHAEKNVPKGGLLKAMERADQGLKGSPSIQDTLRELQKCQGGGVGQLIQSRQPGIQGGPLELGKVFCEGVGLPNDKAVYFGKEPESSLLGDLSAVLRKHETKKAE